MTENHEADAWREQWVRVDGPPTDFGRRVQRRIRRQDRLFLVGNLLTVIAFLGILSFAVLVVRQQSSWLGTGWTPAICVLIVVSAAYRLWIMRGTWRSETLSTVAFAELWRRRVVNQIRVLRVSLYASLGWLALCGALTAANWKTIRPDILARPGDWWEVLLASLLMQPLIWFWATWQRRRKGAELDEVNRTIRGISE